MTCAVLQLVHVVIASLWLFGCATVADQSGVSSAVSSEVYVDTTDLLDISAVSWNRSDGVHELDSLLTNVRQRSGLASWGEDSIGVSLSLEIHPDGLAATTGSAALRAGGSFSIRAGSEEVVIAAVDGIGLRAGVGRLLRELRVRPGHVGLPRDFSYSEDASKALWQMRGHQYTAAHHGSMFRSWEGFDNYTKDQIIFGTNQVELAHFGARPSNLNNKHPTRKPGIVISELVEYSARLSAANVNVSFWWSLDIFQQHQNDTEAAWKAMPRIDSMFFPGGDGGALVWPDITAAVAVLHKYHPKATIWVSAQEVDSAGLDTFFHTITTPPVRSYLTGVVVGPHWRIPTTTILQKMPKGFAVRQYPDICHSRSAQYAIPDWHWAWQFTHGRQV